VAEVDPWLRDSALGYCAALLHASAC